MPFSVKMLPAQTTLAPSMINTHINNSIHKIECILLALALLLRSLGAAVISSDHVFLFSSLYARLDGTLSGWILYIIDVFYVMLPDSNSLKTIQINVSF